MTQEEARQFGLNLLHGIAERNKVPDPCYANNVKQAIDALSAPSPPSNLDEAAEVYGSKEYAHAIHFWDEGMSKNKPEVLKSDFVNSLFSGPYSQ